MRTDERHATANASDDRFWRIFGGTLVAVLAAGVVGLWNMNANVARLEERVAGWTRTFEQRFEATAADLKAHDRRLDALEARP